MRKLLPPVFVLILVFFIALFTLVSLNEKTPVLDQFGELPADLDQKGYSLFPLMADEEGGRVSVSLKAQSSDQDVMLVLAAMRPFSLYQSEKLVYQYSNADSTYQRVHYISLERPVNGNLSFTIQSDSGQKWLKAVLTSPDHAFSYSRTALILNMISIGMHLMIIINCLTLYLQKRSEKYLLMQLFVTLISLTSAFFTADVMKMPFNDAAYVTIQHIIDGISTPAWVFMCMWMAKGGFRIREKGRMTLLYVAVPVLSIGLSFLKARFFSEILTGLLFAYAAVTLIRATMEKKPYSYALLCSFALRFAVRRYHQLTNLGNLPNSELLVYLYTPHFAHLITLVCFLLVINHRFASKFNESDRLVRELEAANATLDAKVAERTLQLKEQQRRKSKMLINIFHDLRSPIFIAQGCADMIDIQSGQNAELLDVLKERLHFLSRLTEELFLIAKLEDGKITFTESEVNLGDLCRTVAEGVVLQAAKSEIRFAYEPCEDYGLTFVGDGFRLKQAVENLVNNALNFTPKGGKIALCLCREQNRAVIQVKDTGKGIPPEEIPQVFERYYSGKRSRRDASTGLGLSIAQEIVRAQGGEIWVESELNQGSTFFISLPLQTAI